MKHTHNYTERGQAMLIITLLMLAGSMVLVAGAGALARNQTRVMTEQTFGSLAYAFAEGVLEETVYRYKNGMSVASTETRAGPGVVATTVTVDIPGGKEVTTTGDIAGRVRRVRATLIEGDGVAFSFGVQSHTGGLKLEGNSYVDGSVYANGPILGRGAGQNDNRSDVYGTVISAGPDGFVSNIVATGSVYARTITNSEAQQYAQYEFLNNSTVPAPPNSTTTSSYMATSTMPISDTLIESWKTYAENAEVYTGTCPYDISTNNTIIGPIKIPCDLNISGPNVNVYVRGAVWVSGNLTLNNSPTIHVHGDLDNRSVPIVVDNPADRASSSIVTMNQSTLWQGNGNRSYVLVVSMNDSVSTGGNNTAIDIKNSASGKLLVYASHGEILLGNHTHLTMITGWRVRIANNSSVRFDSGITSSVFTSGPGVGFAIDGWREVE